MSQQVFAELYSGIIQELEQTQSELSDLKIDNKEGEQKLKNIAKQIQSIQKDFNSELDFLSKNVEWDTFSLSFFGETNAGKSTIIESLRILFDEESRRELIEHNQGDLTKVAEQVEKHSQHVKDAFEQATNAQNQKIQNLSIEVSGFKKFMNQSYLKRLKAIYFAVGLIIGTAVTTLIGSFFWGG